MLIQINAVCLKKQQVLSYQNDLAVSLQAGTDFSGVFSVYHLHANTISLV